MDSGDFNFVRATILLSLPSVEVWVNMVSVVASHFSQIAFHSDPRNTGTWASLASPGDERLIWRYG